MDGYVKVAKQSDLPRGGGKKVKVGHDDLALFDIEGEIFAVTNICPHQHFSVLHEGELIGLTITCPMHGKKFNLRTGLSSNGGGKLRTFAVQIVNDDVWVERSKEP